METENVKPSEVLEVFTTNTEFRSLLPDEISPESSKEVEHWMLGSHGLSLNGFIFESCE